MKAESQQNALVITSEHSCIIKLQRKSYKSELAWWSLAAKHRRFELIPWASQEWNPCGDSGSFQGKGIPRVSWVMVVKHWFWWESDPVFSPVGVIAWKVLAIVENEASWEPKEFYLQELLCMFRSLLLSVLGLHCCPNPVFDDLLLYLSMWDCLLIQVSTFMFPYTHSWHETVLKHFYGH